MEKATTYLNLGNGKKERCHLLQVFNNSSIIFPVLEICTLLWKKKDSPLVALLLIIVSIIMCYICINRQRRTISSTSLFVELDVELEPLEAALYSNGLYQLAFKLGAELGNILRRLEIQSIR